MRIVTDLLLSFPAASGSSFTGSITAYFNKPLSDPYLLHFIIIFALLIITRVFYRPLMSLIFGNSIDENFNDSPGFQL